MNKPLLLNDRLRVFLRLYHFFKNIFSDLTAYGAVRYEIDHGGKTLRRHREISNGYLGIVDNAQHVGHYPVTNRLDRLLIFFRQCRDSLFKVIRKGTVLSQYIAVIFRKCKLFSKSVSALWCQLGQLLADTVDPFIIHSDRGEIWFRKIAVIVCFFLAAHRCDNTVIGIPQERLLDNFFSFLQEIDLPLDLKFDRPFHIPERVHILHFGFCTEFRFAFHPDRYVCVTAKTTLFHIPVANAKIGHCLPYPEEILIRFTGRSHVGLTDNFHQRRTAAVHIYQCIRVRIVNRFPGIFFHMNTGDSDSLCTIVTQYDIEIAVLADRFFIL